MSDERSPHDARFAVFVARCKWTAWFRADRALSKVESEAQLRNLYAEVVLPREEKLVNRYVALLDKNGLLNNSAARVLTASAVTPPLEVLARASIAAIQEARNSGDWGVAEHVVGQTNRRLYQRLAWMKELAVTVNGRKLNVGDLVGVRSFRVVNGPENLEVALPVRRACDFAYRCHPSAPTCRSCEPGIQALQKGSAFQLAQGLSQRLNALGLTPA